MKTNSDSKKNSSPSQSDLENLLNYYQSKQYNLAEKSASILTEKFPNHPFAWSVLGALFNQNGKFKEALTAFQKSITIEPNKSEAHNNLANTFLKLDRLDEAEESCRKAIFLDSKNELAYNNLGQILFELNKFDESESAFRNAISLRQNFVQAYFNLGNTLKTMGKLEEAVSIYTQVSFIEPNTPELYMFRGLTPALIARMPLVNRDDFMESINKCDWASSETILKQSFQAKPSYIVQNVAEFVNLWCALCRDLIKQNAIEKLIPIFIKLIVTVERNKDLNSLIKIFFETFDIDEVMELVKQEDEILINLGYCQYNFLIENFKQAEVIAITNIQKAESLIKVSQTKDLGWLVVKRSLASCSQKDVSRTALTNLVTNLVN